MKFSFTLLLTISIMVTWAQAQNIGIGTPNPDYNLDVNGSVGVNDYIYHNDDPDTWISFPQDNQWEVVAGNQKMLLADAGTGRLVINPTNSNIDLVILADGVDHLVSANTTSRLVGIGTAAPTYLFDVNGDFRVMGDQVDHLFFVNSATDRIGIGTSNPAYAMDVSGDFRIMGDQVDHLFYADAASNRIGIGTGIPSYALDVDGSLRIQGSNNNHLLFVDAQSDRIGLGTSNPQAMLDISGTVSAQDLRLSGNDLGFLNKMQQGNFTVTQNSVDGTSIQQTLTFPNPFPAGVTPKVFLTAVNVSGSQGNLVFVASVKSVNNTTAVININTNYEENWGPWSADLQINWIAFE